MGLEIFSFWVLVWVLVELSTVQFAVLQLSLVLSLILILAALLLQLELNLLAYFLVATYSSVFIALTLLALHFGPFWSPAALKARALRLRYTQVLLLNGGFVIGFSTCLTFATPTPWSGVAANLFYLWQDLDLDLHSRLGGYVGVTHLMFYSIFIQETVGLNLYLFVGLVTTLIILAFRHINFEGQPALANLAVGLRADHLRVVSRFRRQTRRSNSTRLRQCK